MTTTKFKIGDKIKIVDINKVRYPEEYSNEEISAVHTVVRKWTRRWSRSEYVKIRLPDKEEVRSWYQSVTINLDNVIKVNGKIYELKKELMGDGKV